MVRKRGKSLDSLVGLYLHELQDVYDAERQILKALPRMSKAASSKELQEAFKEHEEQTRQQVNRLEQIFEEMGQKPVGRKCRGMQGILVEGGELLRGEGEPEVMDAGLVASAQRVEHYEISVYGTLCSFAEVLGQKEALELLQETLEEEKETDQRLTQIAEQGINEEAAKVEEEHSLAVHSGGQETSRM